MADLSTSGFGSLFTGFTTNPTAALQTSWAIDPVLGNDANVGTPAFPLQTMEQFNQRFYNLFYKGGAGTLQLVGNVLDEPLWLRGTRFGSGSSLTVSGTRTVTSTAIPITLVTGLGPGGTVFPWQLTTTGIDWTTVNLQSQVRLSGGQLCPIVSVVDTNNVIVGAALPSGILVTQTTPTTAMTLEVATLSRALSPQIYASGMVTLSQSPFITIQDLLFDPDNASQFIVDSGAQVQFFGCSFNHTTSLTLSPNGQLQLRCCRVNINTTSFSWRAGSGNNNGMTGSVIFTATPGSGTFLGANFGNLVMSGCTLSGARLIVTGPGSVSTSALHIRGSQVPINIQNGGILTATGIINSGATASGNTGIAIDVTWGHLMYQGSGNKPTILSTVDPRVGGVTKTLAQLPYVAWDATAPTAFTGNGASIIQQG